ncbi:glutaredoxin family protein [Candidatus Nomurabacteria bacterium]|nr:glutaredoxin family protein [Candidatus Nomurabacteria bacterium]
MNIIVYTKTGCPWCIGVTDFLNEKGIEFEERNVTENEDYRKEMEEKSGQTKAPTLDIEGEIIADSDKDEVERVLTAKGVL